MFFDLHDAAEELMCVSFGSRSDGFTKAGQRAALI